MSDEIKKLHNEINKTFEALKEHNDKAIAEAETRGGEATAETRATVDKLNETITDLQSKIKDLEVRAARPVIETADGKEKDPEAELRAAVYDKYLRYGVGESSSHAWEPEERRALSSLSDADGGFLVPGDTEAGIIMAAYDLAEMRPYCDVGQTGRDVVQLGALSKPSVAWGRTNIAVSAQTLTAGAERIQIFPLKALILIHNDTLEDTDANIVGEITGACGLACAEAEDDAFAIGAGDDSPQGVLGDATVITQKVSSGVAAALSDATHNGIDALIGCMYTPKKVYRRNGVWMMNGTTESVVRKLKDGDGQYLWQPSVQAGKPNTLLGRPVINPEGMADIAANSLPIAFGDLKSGYKVRDRKGVTIQRLIERYAEYDQTGFIVKKRVGGKVTLPEAFAVIKIEA